MSDSTQNDDDHTEDIFGLFQEDEEQAPLFRVPSDTFLLFFENIFERELLHHAIEESMTTYSNELFRPQDTIQLCLSPVLLSETLWNGLGSDKCCYICLENMQVQENIGYLPCQHKFHFVCLEKLVSHQHTQCPCCRQSLPLREIQKNESGHHIVLDMS
jgi:hypothetical protein